MPAGIARASASTPDSSTSSMVAGSRSAIISLTSRLKL